MRFLARRLLSGLAILLALSFLSFFLAELAPGDFLADLELDPTISPETLEVLRARYGLDRGIFGRYAAWWGSVASGDLGYSFATGLPVSRLVLPRARNTLLLTVLATALAWSVALPLGTVMAWRRSGAVDRLGLALTSVLLAVPSLLLALLALLLAATGHVFPAGGMTSLGFEALSLGDKLRDLGRHLTLPAVTLAATSLTVLVRHVRSAVLEVADAPYILAARGHGVPTRRLVLVYALPAAANPLVTLFGFSVASLLSGSLIVEIVLGWPGIGPLLLQAILARDLHVVVGATLLSAIFVVVGQLVADIVLVVVDPRIPARDEGGALKAVEQVR